MKKIYSFLFAATALFAAVSCQKEVAPEVEAPKGEQITFTASTEVETKTALHENGKSTIWVKGDQISVFDANKEGNNRCFAIDGLSEDAKTATFSYEGEFVKDQSGMADPTVVALYPYQPNAYCDFFYYDRNYITGINFPAEQTAVAGSFDSKAAFALGLGTMNEKVLGFQNLYALLKFTVRDAGVKKVTVKVNEGAYIAGDAKIQMTLNTEKIGGSEPVFESPVLSIVENGSNTITLTCENGFDTEATYYVAVVPTKFTSISLYCDDVLVNHKDATMTLEANKIYNLKDNGSPKKERGLAFAEEAYTATIGNKFTAPELKGETEGVVYSSSDESIASVNPETGVVTLNKAGSVTITANAKESRYYLAGKASYTLTVKEKQDRALSYSTSTVTVTLNTEYTLPTLSGILKDVRYSSSNTTVADVDASGNVTVKAAGETTITAIADETDEYKADDASYTLTVKPVLTDWNMIGDIGTVNMVKSDVYTDLYVAKNVALNSANTFRFQNKAGDTVVGAYGASTAIVDCNNQINSWYDSNANNNQYAAFIKVSTSGNYDVYFSENDNNFLIIKTGEEEVDSKWEIVGWINGKDSWGGNSGYTLKHNYVTTELSTTMELTTNDYFKILKNKNWTAGTNGGWIGAPGNDGGTKDYTIAVNTTTTVSTHHSYDNHKAQFHMKNNGTYRIVVNVQENPYTSATVKFTRTK